MAQYILKSMTKIYIMVFCRNYNGFLLIFFANSESKTFKMYKIKKDCEIRTSIAESIHNII